MRPLDRGSATVDWISRIGPNQGRGRLKSCRSKTTQPGIRGSNPLGRAQLRYGAKRLRYFAVLPFGLTLFDVGTIIAIESEGPPVGRGFGLVPELAVQDR
jgi:hypothetical protein